MKSQPMISIEIAPGPLSRGGLELFSKRNAGEDAFGNVGAVVVFEGLARAIEAKRLISALNYEVYQPMASRQLNVLAEDIATKHGLYAIHVEHSRGEVPVAACSFRLTIHAAHRKEALAAMDEFIDRMKKDVPIWKTPIWA